MCDHRLRYVFFQEQNDTFGKILDEVTFSENILILPN